MSTASPPYGRSFAPVGSASVRAASGTRSGAVAPDAATSSARETMPWSSCVCANSGTCPFAVTSTGARGQTHSARGGVSGSTVTS